MSKNSERFAGIFDGLKIAYGTYRVDRTKTNGKTTGQAAVVKEPRSPSLWEGHLSGEGDAIGGLGLDLQLAVGGRDADLAVAQEARRAADPAD